MYLDSTRPKPDPFFMELLKKISDHGEIKRVINILDNDKRVLNDIEKQIIESFFYKLSNSIGTLKETILLFCNTFDIDINLIILKDIRILNRLKVEVKPQKYKDISDIF